jgi:hypothetical protein
MSAGPANDLSVVRAQITSVSGFARTSSRWSPCRQRCVDFDVVIPKSECEPPKNIMLQQ